MNSYTRQQTTYESSKGEPYTSRSGQNSYRTDRTEQQFANNEEKFVYRPNKKKLIIAQQKVDSNKNTLIQSQELLTPPSQQSIKELKSSRYTTFRLSGPTYLKYKDPDPLMENPDTVSHSNTLQLAIKQQRKMAGEKTAQFLMSAKPESGVNELDQFYQSLKLKSTAMNSGRSENKSHQPYVDQVQQSKPQMAIDIGEQINQVAKLAYKGTQNAQHCLRQQTAQKWIFLHRSNKEIDLEKLTNKKNLQFAKDLFQIWDIDRDGSISESEAVRPLVSLGLVPDHKFAIKIWQALNPNRVEGQPAELVLEDFLKIFKTDKISDQLMALISSNTQQKQQLQKQKSIKQSDKNYQVKEFSKSANLKQFVSNNSVQDDLNLYLDNEGTYSSKSKSTQADSLATQTERIKKIWYNLSKQVCSVSEFANDLPIRVILNWLVQEKIAIDIEKAGYVIDSLVGKKLMCQGLINKNEFMKLFQRGMFKYALLNLSQTFEEQVKAGKISADLSLSRKLDTYQRNSMIKGIDKNSETHTDIKKMLYSLRDLGQMQNQSKHSKFMQDEQMDDFMNKTQQNRWVKEKAKKIEISDQELYDKFRFVQSSAVTSEEYDLQGKVDIKKNQNTKKLILNSQKFQQVAEKGHKILNL